MKKFVVLFLATLVVACNAGTGTDDASTETIRHKYPQKYANKIFMYSATGGIVDNPNWLAKDVDNNSFKPIMNEKLAEQGLSSPKSSAYYLYVLLKEADELKTRSKMKYVIRDNAAQKVIYDNEFEYNSGEAVIEKTSFGYKKSNTEMKDAIVENIKLFLADFSAKTMLEEGAGENPGTAITLSEFGGKPQAATNLPADEIAKQNAGLTSDAGSEATNSSESLKDETKTTPSTLTSGTTLESKDSTPIDSKAIAGAAEIQIVGPAEAASKTEPAKVEPVKPEISKESKPK